MSSQRIWADGRVASEHPMGVYGGRTFPYPATFVCCGDADHEGAQVELAHDSWYVVEANLTTGAIEILDGPSNIVRGGGEVFLWQVDGGSRVRWRRGQAPVSLPGEGYPEDVDGDRALTADGEKRRLSLWRESGLVLRFTLAGGGLIADDWDGPGAQLLADTILARTDRTRRYSATTGVEIPIPVQNPIANYTIPYFATTGQLILIERAVIQARTATTPELSRLSARLDNTPLGGVVATTSAEYQDFYGLNVEDVGGVPKLVWFDWPNFTGKHERTFAPDFSNLPLVDVTQPLPAPEVPALPIRVAPMAGPLSVGNIFAFHEEGWTWNGEPWAAGEPGTPISGASFPPLDPALPCDYDISLSYEEMFHCIDLGIPCVAFDEYEAEHLHKAGLLWAFMVRNEGGNDLQAAVDALESLCRKYDRGIVVYNDKGFSAWPKRWPKHAVAQVNAFYGYREPINYFRSRAKDIVADFRAAFPSVPVELCPAAFDRNQPGWLPNELGNLQTVAFDLARELTLIGLAPFNWGRGNDVVGGMHKHQEIRDRWIALKRAIASCSRWPRPSEFVTVPPVEPPTVDPNPPQPEVDVPKLTYDQFVNTVPAELRTAWSLARHTTVKKQTMSDGEVRHWLHRIEFEGWTVEQALIDVKWNADHPNDLR